MRISILKKTRRGESTWREKTITRRGKTALGNIQRWDWSALSRSGGEKKTNGFSGEKKRTRPRPQVPGAWKRREKDERRPEEEEYQRKGRDGRPQEEKKTYERKRKRYRQHAQKLLDKSQDSSTVRRGRKYIGQAHANGSGPIGESVERRKEGQSNKKSRAQNHDSGGCLSAIFRGKKNWRSQHGNRWAN